MALLKRARNLLKTHPLVIIRCKYGKTSVKGELQKVSDSGELTLKNRDTNDSLWLQKVYVDIKDVFAICEVDDD